MSTSPPPEFAHPHVLREYALLADGERGAVIGPRGEISFMCFPGWDGDGLFASMIGGDGVYAVTPTGRFVWAATTSPRALSGATAGFPTTTQSPSVVRRSRSPRTRDRAVILRRICALKGPAHMRVMLDLRHDFGRRGGHARHQDDGSLGDQRRQTCARWFGAENASPRRRHDGTLLEFELKLEARRPARPGAGDRSGRRERSSRSRPGLVRDGSHWREHVPKFEQTVAPRDARHAYSVLLGMTSVSGGMVAAATTSLPERAEEGRNYDYRYVWIRDQCYAGQAVARAGAHPLMDGAVRFVAQRLLADGPQSQAGVHDDRWPGARRAGAQPARLSGGQGQDRQLGQ